LNTPTAIFICGPTAVGKTAVSIQVAQQLGAEILSFDSRQFYRELKIGAAPPSPQELQRVPHHFIGHLSIEEKDAELNAGAYEQEALHILETQFSKRSAAVLVGGSGLYMRALTHGFDPLPPANEVLRKNLNEELARNGLDSLVAELTEKDPIYALKADLQNPQRVIRALEVIRGSGHAYSAQRREVVKTRPFKQIKIGLNLPREELYTRINQRVDLMIEAGLEEEARALYPFREVNALQTVGYKEWWPYFENKRSHYEVVEEIKKNSRRYAKRQLTWFKREDDIRWFTPDQVSEIMDYIQAYA
jgi:tRNA dimethylallyltransferase